MDLSILSRTYYYKFSARSAINTQCDVSKSGPDPVSTAFWRVSVPVGRWSHVFLGSPASWVTLQGDWNWSVMHTAKELVKSQTVSLDVSTFRVSPDLKIRKIGSVRQRGWGLMCPWRPLHLCACLRGSFCCCDKYRDQKQLREEQVYFYLQCTVHHPGKSVQELKAGTKAESTEELCSLACSSWISQFTSVYNPGTPAQVSAAHPRIMPPIFHWALPNQLSVKKILINWLAGQLDGGHISSWGSLFLDDCNTWSSC